MLNNYQYLILVLVMNVEMVLCKVTNVRFNISQKKIHKVEKTTVTLHSSNQDYSPSMEVPL